MVGHFERAANLFIRALEIQCDDYRSPLFLQNVFNSLGRQEEREKYARLGLKRAEDALRLHPESSDPAQMGAIALAALGERDRAKEWIARALAIDPNDNNTRYNAACAYSLLGELDRAVALLETWIQQTRDAGARSPACRGELRHQRRLPETLARLGRVFQVIHYAIFVAQRVNITATRLAGLLEHSSVRPVRRVHA